MEEEFKLEQENANMVLDQEYSELLHILNNQPSNVITKLCAMVPGVNAEQTRPVNTTSSLTTVKALLDFYSQADSSLCCDFLQCICLLCENIPLWLESRLMSVSADPTNACDISRKCVAESSEVQDIKRPRIDYWEQYITSVKHLQMGRWGAMRKCLVMDVELNTVWVNMRRKKIRDQPDQTPAAGSRTPDFYTENWPQDAKVTLDTFLQDCTGKITVLYGPSGSGKTILMSRLGELWASNLGPIPSSHLFVLLEFRHLNLLSQPLSFYELLFQHYLPPEGEEEKEKDIFDYLLSNPEESCWVLDGYDEFHCNFNERDSNNAHLDPRIPRPVAELISGLLNRLIFPGCTVIFTCRLHDATDFEHQADKVGQFQHWNHYEIKKYVDSYFDLKGNSVVGKHATKLLLSNKHLVSMSSLPGLCHFSCICLEYLLAMQGSDMDKEDVKKVKEDELSVPQMPFTLSQVYLMSIGAFLSRCSDQEHLRTTADLSQSVLCHLTSLVSQFKSELTDLCKLAWNGLEEKKILFLEEEIPNGIVDFSVNTGFISKTEVRRRGVLVNAYYFIHLTVQEFLSALKIMTSMNDKELKNSFHSRKYGDSFAEKLTTVLPKLASLEKLSFCDANLTAIGAAHLATGLLECPCIREINLSGNNLRDEGTKHITDIVSKLPQLSSLNLGHNSTTLNAAVCLIKEISSMNILSIYIDGGAEELMVTFDTNCDHKSPKMESQAEISLLIQKWSTSGMRKLAQSLMQYPPISVLNLSGGHWKVETLKELVTFLPKFNITNKIILNGSCSSVEAMIVLTKVMSDCAAVSEIHISSESHSKVNILFGGSDSKSLSLSHCALQPSDLDKVLKSLKLAYLTSLDLSNNILRDEGMKILLNGVSFLRQIREINASNNGVTMEGVEMLAGSLCCHNHLMKVHTSHNGSQTVLLKFRADQSTDQLRVFSLNSSSLKPEKVTSLFTKLIHPRILLQLDLSYSPLSDDTIKNMVEILPKITSLQTLNLTGCSISTPGALMLVRGVTDFQRVKSVQLSSQRESIVLFDKKKQDQFSCRISHFSLDRHSLGTLLETLQSGPQLSELDLSNNNLDENEVKYFVDTLPKLNVNNYINLSNNCLKQQGMLVVVNTLSTCDNVSAVEVCLAREPKCIIWLKQGPLKHLRVTEATLTRNDQDHLIKIISRCRCPIKVELKHCLSESVEAFVEMFDSNCSRCSLNIEESWIRSEEAVRLLCHCLELSRNITTISIQQTTLHLSFEKSDDTTYYSVCGDTVPQALRAPRKIGLVDCGIQGIHLAPLEDTLLRCPYLTELDLSKNCLGEVGAQFLCSVIPSLPKLTSLRVDTDMSRCAHFAEILCKSLPLCKNLQYLSLSGCVISEIVVHTIASVLPCLKLLNLSSCSWSNAVGLQLTRSLAYCERLEELWLDCVHLNQESKMCLVQSLTNTATLRVLKLSKVSTSPNVWDVLVALASLAHLEDLEMDSWKMNDKEVEQLIRLLPLWTHLKKICLSQTFYNDQSSAKLLEALKTCSHLKELHISRNNLGDLTTAKMALVFPSLTHLCVIDISESKIGPKGCVDLAKAICCLKNLTKMNLTSIGTSELRVVVASLTDCPQIQDVRLGWNNCGDDVALELVQVLPLCRALEIIDLECNCVSLIGAESLLKALQSCPALKIIRLWRNKVPVVEANRLSLMDRRLNFSST